VVEKIGDVSLEVVGVEHPSAIRDGDAELMLFVALTVKWKESATGRLTLRDERARHGFDRRA